MFHRANLKGAHFETTHVSSANFEEACLKGAHFEEANFKKIHVELVSTVPLQKISAKDIIKIKMKSKIVICYLIPLNGSTLLVKLFY